MIRKATLLGIGTFLSIIGLWWLFFRPAPVMISQPKPRPLLQYTFENLRKREYQGSSIEFTQNKFFFYSDGKKVSGAVNLPEGVSTSSALTKPVIIMLRGYADRESYYPGFGTQRVAEVLAQNGFVTLAPDFLGYGDSDMPSSDVFEERFQTYTTVLNLMASVKPVGIWGHSNGGQIALSVLEISGANIPTVLWNPVSITFPYSILYYTWDSDDHGKALRKNLATFEADYDTELYSPTNYLDWITAPILLQQGELDQSVPKAWSDDLSKKIKAKYIVYSGSDHNLMPLWNQAAADALKFLQTNL